MKNGRILAAAMAEKHPRPTACIGLALSVLLLCNGCMTQFHSSSFDVKPKPASSVSGTNFRVQAVSDDEHDHEFESHLRTELEKLEQGQNASLPAVPYSVDLRYLGHEETSDTTKMLTGLLYICSCFVIPHWDTTTHKWEISTVLPGETGSFRGERSSTDVISWFMLPLGMRDFFSSGGTGGGSPSLSESMAKAIFDSLTQTRYDKAVSDMRLKAKQQLLGGKRLSEADERLLENDASLETFAARAMHPANKNTGLAAVARIDDPETLADIALHSAVPEIRQTAAQRATGLPEARFAELAAESSDLEVADTFLNRISDDALLCQVAENRSALEDIKAVAVEKIRQESALADIAKSQMVHSSLNYRAVSRIGTESVLADVAAHAPDADIRKAAIERIDNPSILIVAVAKDADPANRLAALDRISHPKALAAIMRKSDDAEVRLQAVRKITDPAVLQETVAGDADAAVRLAALQRVSDQEVLARAAETDPSPEVRAAAMDKLSDPAMLAQIAKNSAHAKNRLAALAKITDDAVICDIAQSDTSVGVRVAAAAKTRKQEVLARIAQSDSASVVRIRAAQELHDQDCLASIARQDEAADVRMAAVERLNAQDVLKAVSASDKSPEVRAAAAAKIDDPAFLASIARQDADPSVRRVAFGRVDDQAVLAGIARADPAPGNRILAIQRLGDEVVLREIALSEQDPSVRDSAWQKLPEPSRKALLASMARKLFLKAEKAEEDGRINFCGFYTGMPEADAEILAQHYGLKSEEWSCECLGEEVAGVYFTLQGLQRVTKSGHSFEELVWVVSDHVGYLSPEPIKYANSSGVEEVDFLAMLYGQATEVGAVYHRKTVDGIHVIMAEKKMAGIPPGFAMWDDDLVERRAEQRKSDTGGEKSDREKSHDALGTMFGLMGVAYD